MNSVLVTGASGFVGRQVLAPLHARGYEVHAITQQAHESTDGVLWHTCDLLDVSERRALLDQLRPNAILHFAWYAEPGKYWTSPLNLDWLQATLGLLVDFAEGGGQRFIGAGSCAEYQWQNRLVCHELETPVEPATLYGVCKDAARRTILAFARARGLSAAWGRIFSLYGPYEHPSRLVAEAASALLRGARAECRHAELMRDYLHVSDVGRAFIALMESSVQGSVNIASGEAVSLGRIVQAVASEVGRPEAVLLGIPPTPRIEPQYLIADVTRLRDEVGFKPTFDLSSGIADTVGWWRAMLAGNSSLATS